jgi:hypothetical protein
VRYSFCTARSGAVARHALARAAPTTVTAPIALGGGTTSHSPLPVTASTAAVLMTPVAAAAEKEKLTAAGRHTLHDPQ